MAGLCAARVLEPFFEKITLVDRDGLPDGPTPRAGVPQSRHVHALIPRGARELEAFFPGFLEEYEAAGAHALDVPYDGTLLRYFGWQRPMRSGTKAYFATRDLTESIVRRRLRERGRVEILDRADVTALDARPDGGGRVSAVRVTRKDGGAAYRAGSAGAGANLVLDADLVVDASGRTSKAMSWLQALGRPAPREEVVDCYSGYSSRWYELPEPSAWPRDFWWKVVWIDPSPPEHLMGGVLFPVEGRRFIVTLIGYSKHYPPNDEEGFKRALEALRSPVLARVTEICRPVSPVHSSRALKNRLRRYDELADPAPGLVAVGDSVCTFNPMYGQGMTIAALSSRALEETLGRVALRDAGFERVFFATHLRYIKDAWRLATGADMRFPGVSSDLPPPSEFAKFFGNAIQHGMIVDGEVLRRVASVSYLLEPTRTLFEDRALFARIVLRGVLGTLKERMRSRSLPAMPPGPPA